MKTARHLMLAAVLLGLVAVAPAKADASGKELFDILLDAATDVFRAGDRAENLSPTFAKHRADIKHACDHAYETMEALGRKVKAPAPPDQEELVKQTEIVVHYLDLADDLADEVEEQADDDDDDEVEDLAKTIRRDLRNSKSHMRDFLKLLD